MHSIQLSSMLCLQLSFLQAGSGSSRAGEAATVHMQHYMSLVMVYGPQGRRADRRQHTSLQQQ
jgi:hypothetical protein